MKPPDDNNNSGKLISRGARYIILSTLFFALMNIGVKYLERIPAYEIVFFRALVSLIICFFALLKVKIPIWGNNKKILIARGIAGTVALMMYFYTLQRMPLASAVVIQYLSPIFTIIIAALLLKERGRAIQWLFFFLSFVGVVLVKGFDPRIEVADLFIGICAAVFSGLAYNFIRMLRNDDHPLVVVFYFPLVTVPVIGIYTFFNWVTPDFEEWLILLGIGVATTFAQIFMTKGYQADKATNVSNFNYLGAIYAIVIGYLMFGESVLTMGFIGIGLIITGVVLGSRYRTT